MAADTHTRRYLLAILSPATAPAPTPTSAQAALSSPRLASLSASRAAAEDGNTSISSYGSGSGIGATAPAEEESHDGTNSVNNPRAGTASMSRSFRTESMDREGATLVDVEARTRMVLDLLSSSGIPEEDKPDKLRELLSQITAGTEASNIDLDSAVLAILHRHREDILPTGQTFSSPTPASRQIASISRSSSFRRNLTPTSASTLAIKRATGMTTPTRPISPSPLRSQSPSIYISRKDSADPFEMGLQSSSNSGGGAMSSARSSPFGSPRFLNAGAIEFRPNTAALEFKPSTPTISLSNLSVKLPEQIRTRSPVGTPIPDGSPTVWSFQNSPLGTPKFATGGVGASPSFSAGTSNGSYFPSFAAANAAAGPSVHVPTIPSDPWTRLSDSSLTSTSSNPGISHSASTASSESSYDETQFDPFAPSPSASNHSTPNKSTGKAQILSNEDEDEDVEEWGMAPMSLREYASSEEPTEDDEPRWNLYDDERNDDDGGDYDDLRIFQIKEGQLLPDADDLAIVEPIVQQRPIFDEEYYPQSTAQYSQLPQDFPSPSSLHRNSMTPSFAGSGGLETASASYVMTPFDVLCTVFAGSEVSPTDLEEALSKNGWDVDRSMEWIIHHPRLPGTSGSGIDQIEAFDIPSLKISDEQHGSGDAVSPARMHSSPVPSGSGSRPLVISRDSFQRSYGKAGRPSSPLWPPNETRPGTPGGRSDRSGDAQYGGTAGAPSTRLCKYYLQGNCLRSDCRFSHDLSKAVCKFWLRGHCLKGEGRCEFLHSVPPHLANDVAALRANALRLREQEKGRYARGPFDEAYLDLGHRVQEDFPSLAAATAPTSSSQRHGGPSKDPAASRWAGVVKNGRPIPVHHRPISSSALPPNRAAHVQQSPAPYSQPRQSARILLRPPTLLPTITTGAAVMKLYEQYRENFFEYGNTRNKCLVKAAECWKKGDGAGAKRWSREAQDWNRQIAQEGALAASGIVTERKKSLREAVMSGDRRPGRADESIDRQYRGKECGAGLGVCLGVAAVPPMGESAGSSASEGARLTASERTEAALDLHGLHPDEAIDILEQFLLAVPHEANLRGLVYIVVGQEKHTGTADAARGSRKIRLADAVGSWLDSFHYAFWLTNGIFVVDPYL